MREVQLSAIGGRRPIEDIKSITLHTIARDIVIRAEYNEVFTQVDPAVVLATKDGKRVRVFEYKSEFVCGVSVAFRK